MYVQVFAKGRAMRAYMRRFCVFGIESVTSTVEPLWKDRKISLKLQNLVHFHAPFFINHVYFTLHDRPPLLKGHHIGWPL